MKFQVIQIICWQLTNI